MYVSASTDAHRAIAGINVVAVQIGGKGDKTIRVLVNVDLLYLYLASMRKNEKPRKNRSLILTAFFTYKYLPSRPLR